LLLSGASFPVDFGVIKKELNCKEAKLFPRKDLFNTTGFEAGHVPLVGLNLPCLIDKKLMEYPYVYGGIGNPDYTLKINPKDLQRINNTIAVIDL